MPSNFTETLPPWGEFKPDPNCGAPPVATPACPPDPEKDCYNNCHQKVKNQNENCKRIMKAFVEWMKANGCKGAGCKYRKRNVVCAHWSSRSRCGSKKKSKRRCY